jgi:2-keto-4-pentenoate hydratase/2-oxohepta-3-ene-1,7-dioic acid hydratase in catechol pathway
MVALHRWQTDGAGKAWIGVGWERMAGSEQVKRFVRFRRNDAVSWGLVDGEFVREITGEPYGEWVPTGDRAGLAGLKLLAPVTPPKIFAIGLNYRSHLGNRPAPATPEIFYKPITSVQHPEEPIAIPAGAANVHFEGELVVVIGTRTRNVSKEEAPASIFGVTCGNDVSERNWQRGEQKDLQWWRAKGCDTFGPLGPAAVRGLDYGNLTLETRLNGEVVQRQSTSDLIFDCATVVSFISGFVTLEAGDLIYTGTPGTTRAMKAGDVVEVEIEGIGVLRNPVTA